jgi:formylglycine-generating enzyme required for sulfatase activity
LLEASGYARRPQDFEDLLNILDRELRLITPTDPEGVESGGDGAASTSPGQKHYQLTHDYLVTSLREWLTRKQKETRRGRAELRLAERAALWNPKPENRHLPSWWEYLNIRCLTERKKWTEPQQRMMRRAGRVLGLRWCVVLVAMLISGLALQQVVSHQQASLAEQAWQNDQKRAESLVEAVLTAPADGVPYAIENLRELREHAIPILRSRFSDTTDPRHRLHAAFALASFGEVESEYISNSIAGADTRQCANIVSALRKSDDSVEGGLRQAAGEAEGKQDWRGKARVAIVAMHLGFPHLVKEVFQLRPDPVQRTILIDTFELWHGDAAELAPMVAETSDAAFRSGICLAVGSIGGEAATPEVKQAWEHLLLDWYRNAPDSGTHSASGWTLRQWQVPLPDIPASDEPVNGRQWYVNSVQMTMLRIPEGEFVRIDEARNAKPQEVTLKRPFYLSDREVSVGLFQQFKQFMDDADLEHEKPRQWGGVDTRISPSPDYPVQNVSWFDAVKFCNWLSRREGRMPCYELKGGATQETGRTSDENWEVISAANGYRLPTEAEWEYACRAGSQTAYTFGDDVSLLGKYGVLYSDKAEEVGSRLPNAWGLFDMHSNVWEWCQDWYGPYGEHRVQNPQGPTTGSSRVYRGGSWYGTAGSCRSANRYWIQPSIRFNYRGFRVARSLVDGSGVTVETPLPPKTATPSEPRAEVPSKTTPQPMAGESRGTVPPLAVAPFDAVAAQAHQQAWAKHLGQPVEVTNSIGMKLKLIPPGEFLMGSADSDWDAGDAEKPQHTVWISKAFYLGVTEVTQEQYERVMGANPSTFKGAQLPVEKVSWDDAVEFCRKLSVLSAERSAGRVYRLPTDAEWEYACRAGSRTKWSFGDAESSPGDYAWYWDNSGNKTHPVGTKKPNAWGLYDMHGNVWEWCLDWYDGYASTPMDDPVGPATGSLRVSRGGGWSSDAGYCRSAFRSGRAPDSRYDFLGFRLVFSTVDQSGR